MIGGGGTPSLTTHDSRTWRIAASLTGDFNDTWGWDAGLQRSENNFAITAEDTVSDRMRSALSGLGGPNCDPAAGTPGVGDCHYLNPFGSALTGTDTVNSPELIDYIQGPYDIDSTTGLTTLDGVVTGEIGNLPGGRAGLAIGAQIREEESRSDYSEIANRDGFMFVVGNPDFSSSRQVTAAFVELLLPVSVSLDLQLAARIEDYGGGLDSTDPKATLLWRPNPSLAVRGSIGTSFRAPSMFQAFGTQTTLEELADPLSPGRDAISAGTDSAKPFRQGAQARNRRCGEPGIHLVAQRHPGTGHRLLVVRLHRRYHSAKSPGVAGRCSGGRFGGRAAGRTRSHGQSDPRQLVLRQCLIAQDRWLRLLDRLHDRRRGRNVSFRVAGDSGLQLRTGGPAGRSDRRCRQAQLRKFRHFRPGTASQRVPELAKKQSRHQRLLQPHRLLSGRRPARHAASHREPQHGGRPIQYFVSTISRASPCRSARSTCSTRILPPVATNGGFDSKVHDPRGRLLYAKAGLSF